MACSDAIALPLGFGPQRTGFYTAPVKALSLQASQQSEQGCSSQAPVLFTRPTATLSVSLTGARCALNCAHCGGHYLQHMRAIQQVEPNGYHSLLMSGGCDPQGRVPITAALNHVVRLHSRCRMNWHVGFAGRDEVAQIAPYADMISFDIVGDRETTQEVYGLDVGLDDYMAQLALLREIAPVVPHVTLGLRAGRFSGEARALHALAEVGVDKLVLLILIPTAGTRYADVPAPELSEVQRHFDLARQLLPAARIYLGCMRPHGRYRQQADELAMRAGLDGIVNPSKAAITLAEAGGRPIVWGDECCAFL